METVVWSKPEDERAGTPLLVMMHGYGTDESRMVQAVRLTCRRSSPAPRCAAPMVIGDHYGWFLLDYFLANDFADVIAATNAVFAWIESVKAPAQQRQPVRVFAGHGHGQHASAAAGRTSSARPSGSRASYWTTNSWP